MVPKDLIAIRTAKELHDGDVVNLGIGIPTLVPNFIPSHVDVYLHTENGLLGVGPTPAPDCVDENLVNAGKQPVTEMRGSSFFASDVSFAMIRGGHIDVAILGALQVDGLGRVANWSVPGQTVLGVGGAMDLLVGAKRVIVAMTHTHRDGTPKLVKNCDLPITANRSVDVIITDLAVFKVRSRRMVLSELMPGATVEQVTEKTAADFDVNLV